MLICYKYQLYCIITMIPYLCFSLFFSAALQKKEYQVCGKVMALSIIHGGPTPHFFSPVLYDAVTLGSEKCHVNITDMPPCEVKHSMLEVTI